MNSNIRLLFVAFSAYLGYLFVTTWGIGQLAQNINNLTHKFSCNAEFKLQLMNDIPASKQCRQFCRRD